MNRTSWGQILAPILALVGIAASLAFLFSQETPVGSVRGTVVLSDTGKPLDGTHVYLTPESRADTPAAYASTLSDDPRTRHQATTDSRGAFVMPHVPIGTYRITASTEYHSAVQVALTVSEAKTEVVAMQLKRSQPAFTVGDHQRVWATREKPTLPIRGYVDPKRPFDDAVHVTIFKTRLSTILRDPKAAADLERMGHSYESPPATLPDSLRHPAGVAKADAPRRVGEQDVTIRRADREGFFAERMSVPRVSGPGLYLLQLSHGTDRLTAWVLATDTALVVKRAGPQLMAYAVDMTAGTPVKGAEIRQYRAGSLAAHGTTDANGLVTLIVATDKKAASGDDSEGGGDSTDDSGDAPRFLTVAVRGNDEAVLAGSGFNYEDGGRYLMHAVTDRTVYRPGHRIQYRIVLRKRQSADPGALPYDVPRGEAVSIEVRDPDGGRVVREHKTTNAWGAVSGAFDLSAEAATGVYSLVCVVNGEKHTADVSVASYRKPEFAVTVTPDQPRYVRGDTVTMTIQGRYYYGAPVAGGHVKYYLTRETDWASMYGDAYDPEDDGAPDEPPGAHHVFSGSFFQEGEATLDGDGKAVVTFPSDPVDARRKRRGKHTGDPDDSADAELPQEQIYSLSASVTDDAKRSVDNDGKAHVSAGDFLLTVTPEGYVAEPGRPTNVVVRAIDHDNKPVSGVTVYLNPTYEKWDAKSETSKTEHLKTIQGATGADGTALLAVTPTHAGDLRLPVTAYDAKGRALHANSYVWAARDRGGNDLDTEYADLSLLTDKRQYAPGDTARVLVNTARTGQTVLLTVEGERVFQTYLVPIRQRSTVVRVHVSADYGPNVTLAACYVRNKKFATSEIPLRVALAARALTVSVTADKDKYLPGATATYTVNARDAAGKPAACEFSLSVVDEAIYGLREDDPKSLLADFYPRRTNRVRTTYSFSVTYLGDNDKSEPKIEMRRKFLDTAFWRPDLTTDARTGTATVTVALPDNLTTWRATVQAVTADTAVGRAVSKVLETKPFFVRLETPRFLTQHDDGCLLVLIHNDTGARQSAHVRLTAPGLLTGTPSPTQTVTVEPGADGPVEWPVRAETLGDVKLRAEAWTDASDATTGKPWTDGVETTLPVRAYGRVQVTAMAGATETVPSPTTASGRVFTIEPEAILPETRLTVRVTPSLRGAMVGSLDYLIGFPYGCTEQTMSRFLPDLLIAHLEQETRQPLLTGPGAVRKRRDLPRMVRDGILRLKRLQQGSGTWGWWENDGDDVFLTSYVLYGLGTARDAGYEIPEKMLSEGRKGGLKILETTAPNDRPFLLYALALSGETERPAELLRALNASDTKRAGMDTKKLAPDALAYLVLLAKRVGGDYRPALAALGHQAVSEGKLIHWKNQKYRWRSSDRMATATALRALLAADSHDGRITPVLHYLMLQRTENYWGDTRDTSAVLSALVDYLRVHPEDAAPPSGSAVVRMNGSEVRKVDLNGADTGEIVVHVPASALRVGDNRMEVTRDGGQGTLFWGATLRQVIGAKEGVTLAPLSSEQITIKREYLRVSSERIGTSDKWSLTAAAVKNNDFHQGDQVRVRLTIHAPRDLEYVLIEDSFPSNCEVTERGTAEAAMDGDAPWSWWYSHIDVRDDRIAVFATTLRAGTQTVEYNLRAKTPGTARALPAHLEAMYAPAFRAESASDSVEVGK